MILDCGVLIPGSPYSQLHWCCFYSKLVETYSKWITTTGGRHIENFLNFLSTKFIQFNPRKFSNKVSNITLNNRQQNQ